MDDAGVFDESCVERVVEGLCDLRHSRSQVIVSSDCGVTGWGKGKGTESVVAGVGGSEIRRSGIGGVEGAEVGVDVMLDKVGSGGKFGFRWFIRKAFRHTRGRRKFH